MLVITINISPKKIRITSNHKNLIILNPITKTFEYYEPHGEAITNKGYDTEHAVNILQKYIMDFIDDDLKFIPPSDTCPRRPKNMPKKE